MLATSLARSNPQAQFAAWSSLALLFAVTGCGTGAYEERLEATVATLRANPAAAKPGEAAERPGTTAAELLKQAVPEQNEAPAAEAAGAAGQGGVVGRTILAPTDALP